MFYGLPKWFSGKELPTMQETWVQSLGQENPLEKEMATHSAVLAWEIPRTEEPGGLQSMELQESHTQLHKTKCFLQNIEIKLKIEIMLISVLF